MEIIGEEILPVLGQLEWLYIFSFILLGMAVEQLPQINSLRFLYRIKKRFRIAIIGLIYAPFYYYMSGLEEEQAGLLFASFLFTFVFHKLLVEAVIGFIQNKTAKLSAWKRKKEEQ